MMFGFFSLLKRNRDEQLNDDYFDKTLAPVIDIEGTAQKPLRIDNTPGGHQTGVANMTSTTIAEQRRKDQDIIY